MRSSPTNLSLINSVFYIFFFYKSVKTSAKLKKNYFLFINNFYKGFLLFLCTVGVLSYNFDAIYYYQIGIKTRKWAMEGHEVWGACARLGRHIGCPRTLWARLCSRSTFSSRSPRHLRLSTNLIT